MTGTLKIGEAVLSYQDGRLHISKGLVSDGDLAAFAAEEGEEGGSGGLDIARLWEELAAEDASKVIDVSHIPGSVVLQDELVEILDDYPLTTEMNTALAGKAALKHTHIITDVSSLQTALNSKWEWDASQVAGVKVSSAVAADRLATARRINGTSFDGTSDIVTARWGATRTITIWDFYNANKQAAQGIDGSADFGLKLPQSIKVKTLNIDGVTLSVVGGRLHVDSTLTADGDLVAYGDGEGSSGGGLDEEAMWAALGGSMSSKVISPSHLPSLSSLSGNLDSSRITGLDSALTSYAKKDGSNASGTWPVSISGNAASADISNYLYLNPNNGYHAAQNDAVPANGRFAIYDVNVNTTAGGSDGYIMAFRWPSGNYASQIYVDVDNTGIMALRHRSNSNVWSEWSRILHSSNIGSYALTPSNYTATLDSRYVKKAGDTMTGILEMDRAGESIIRYWISGVKKAATGYLSSYGAYLYSWPAGKYLNITDAGALQFGGQSVWHSGNDGAGSGLDADLLDGYQASSFALQSADNILTAHGNEFNFVPGGFSGSIYINYRTKDGANADISEYIFSRGQRNTSVHANVRAANFLATGKLQGDYFDGGYISNYNTNKTYWVGDATRGISSAKAGLLLYSYGSTRSVYIYTNAAERMVVNGVGYVGIGTASPAYRLDVSGRIRAVSGITIGSTDDIGWYWEYGGRLGAGDQVARGCNVGSLLVSNAWADYTKVPENGIYCKGDFWTDSRLYVPSVDGNQVYDIYIA